MKKKIENIHDMFEFGKEVYPDLESVYENYPHTKDNFSYKNIYMPLIKESDVKIENEYDYFTAIGRIIFETNENCKSFEEGISEAYHYYNEFLFNMIFDKKIDIT